MSQLVFETAGTIDLAGVYGFPMVALAGLGANSISLHNVNFAVLSSPVITVNGGDLGNSVDASTLAGVNRVVLNGGIRADQLTGGASNDILNGGGGNDTLNGNAGNDTLNGGAGADSMAGGGGNDTYIVDNAGDVVTEAASAGTDTVKTNLSSYTLGANVENLTFIGSGSFAGTGNALKNTITAGAGADTLHGGAGNDTLNGGTGADTMAGGGGNDTYIVDNAGDVVTEAATAGTDIVKTTLASYTLGANVENLTYTRSSNFAGTGNSLNNVITGGGGNDTLNGGGGNDTLNGGAGSDKLTGGRGNDSFLFNTALSATTNVDHIFDSVNDKILLSHSVFTQAGGIGPLAAGAFHTGPGAADAGDRIVYNSTTGALIYDSNGNLAGGATQFAILSTGLTLTHTNFQIV
ncbi:MAG: calcium-binding protein [Stellaceae bacterium]